MKYSVEKTIVMKTDTGFSVALRSVEQIDSWIKALRDARVEGVKLWGEEIRVDTSIQELPICDTDFSLSNHRNKLIWLLTIYPSFEGRDLEFITTKQAAEMPFSWIIQQKGIGKAFLTEFEILIKSAGLEPIK